MEKRHYENAVKWPEKIMVPVDFSDLCTKAIRYGASIAHVFDSQLLFITVLEPPALTFELGYASSTFPGWDETVIKQTKKKLDDFVGHIIPPNLDYDCIVRPGTAAETILECATENNVDILITSTHGRTGLKHVLVGSVAEKLVRYGHPPVLVLPRANRDFFSFVPQFRKPQSTLTKILVPFDFSGYAYAALEKAEIFAKQFSAEIIILHVLEVSENLNTPTIDQQLTAIEGHLEAIVAREKMLGFTASHHLLQGRVRDELLGFAEENQVELIVLGARGHSGFKELLLGSTTEYVLRHSHCPVLTVQCPRHLAIRKAKKFSEILLPSTPWRFSEQ